MFLRRFLRSVFRDRAALRDQLRPRRPRAQPGFRPQLELLESWCLPNLLLGPIPFGPGLGLSALARIPLAGAEEGYGDKSFHDGAGQSTLEISAGQRLLPGGSVQQALAADASKGEGKPASSTTRTPAGAMADFSFHLETRLRDLDFLNSDPVEPHARLGGTADVTSSPPAEASDPAIPRSPDSPAGRTSEPAEGYAPQGLAAAGIGQAIPFIPPSLAGSSSAASAGPNGGLLGLARQTVNPDITSGGRTNFSYTNQGNDANPLHYDAVPLLLTLSNGPSDVRTFPVDNPTGGQRSTELNVVLDNAGQTPTDNANNEFHIAGKVTIDSTTYDDTLVTGKVRAVAARVDGGNGEFEVEIGITGGTLTTGPNRRLRVSDEIGLLIHEPDLPISSFPQTFSVSSFLGISDAKKMADIKTNTNPERPNCGCATSDVPTGGNAGAARDTGNNSVIWPSGASWQQRTDGKIPGRGILAWSFTSTYRSDVQEPGPLGHNWEMNYENRLWIVTGENQPEIQHSFPLARPGDVVRVDGFNRADIYVRNPDGVTYTSPNGFFTRLDQQGDGTFSERDQTGTITTYERPDNSGVAAMTGMADRENNTLRFQYDPQDHLTLVTDTLNRHVTYMYDARGLLTEVHDFDNRALRFQYDSRGELIAETSPAVTDTPTGNDFPDGKTTHYTYSEGLPDAGLNHELLTVTAPNEVATGGPPRLVYTYDDAGRVTDLMMGGTNATGVPAGGTIHYRYDTLVTEPPNDLTTAVSQITATDRNGNITDYQFNRLGNVLQTIERTHQPNHIRPSDPDLFRTTFQYDRDYHPILETMPQGNTVEYVYNLEHGQSSGGNSPTTFNDTSMTWMPNQWAGREVRITGGTGFGQTRIITSNTSNQLMLATAWETIPDATSTYEILIADRFQQDNLLAEVRMPDTQRGGDQGFIKTTYTYEPMFNQVHTMTDPRGNDADFRPPIILPGETFPNPARYTTVYTYDYQEGTDFAGLAQQHGGSAADIQQLLTDANIPMGLGDVNGDGRTDQIHGNLIRTQQPTVHLLPGSNEAVVEGTTLQPIVTLYVYNDFSQMIRTTDPELNVTKHAYYSVNNPSGPPIDPAGGGYLAETIADAPPGIPGRDSGTNPTPANIHHVYLYDAVGNVTQETDGRGIVTTYDVNQLNQVVQTTRAALVPGVSADEPLPLTAFQYLTRTFDDYNDNVVLTQVEDRGNTSDVAGPLPSADAPAVPGDFNPAGLAFASTITKYDILDQRLETVNEVSNGANPEFLRTRYRYDPNGNLVLTIQPEGNATTSFYDERDLLYQSVQGATAPPPLVLLAAADPTDYDVRGGLPSTTTYEYDLNRNLVETVAADDTDLSLDNNSKRPSGTSTGGNDAMTLKDTNQHWMPNQWKGRTVVILSGTGADLTRSYTISSNTATQLTIDTPWMTTPDDTSVYSFQGDRTRYLYDGFDRRVSTVDSVGDQTVTQYDPVSNMVRVTSFGPVGEMSPTNDGRDPLPGPVSSLGVLQTANLAVMNNPLLAATENQHDELNRNYQTGRVLFVNTIPTVRPPDVAEGGSDVGLGNLMPGQTAPIAGISNVTILGRVSSRTEYDRDSRATFAVRDDTTTSRTFYDGVSRLIKTVDPEHNMVESAYDADNNVIETRETDVSQVSGIPNEVFLTTSFYDSLNRVQRRVDNLGQTMDYRYDSRDNLVAMADAQGPVTVNTITRRAFSSAVVPINDFGNVTRYTYDGIDRKTRDEVFLTPLILPGTAQGDGVHIGASIEGVKDDPTKPESFPPAVDPNQGGNRHDGIIRTGYTYDANSLQSALIDDQGNVTVYLYDNFNRRVTQTGGMTVDSVYTKANILGPRDVVTPTPATINDPAVIPASQIDAQLAEAAGRITALASLFPSLADRVDDHPPTTIMTGYDPDSNVLIRSDENNSYVYTKYDGINRAIAVRVFRADQNDSFAGDLIFAPAPVSLPTNHSFDNKATFQNVAGTTIQDFLYDGLSRMTKATDNNDPATSADDSVVMTAYDSLGRVIEETQKIGALPAKATDSAQRAENLRFKLTYPNNRVEVYTYDQLERLKSVKDQGAAQDIAQYKYIGVGRVLERSYPINGTRETYLNNTGTADVGYDALRRPIQLRHLMANNSLIVGFTHTYDRMNNKLSEGKLHDAANSESYSYDSAYRLIDFQRAVGGRAPLHRDWKLDGVGNWKQDQTTETGPATTETRQHSSFNEITKRTIGSTTKDIISDDNGNETDDGKFLYTWDAQNRLRTVTLKTGGLLIATYSYDALGRRSHKVITNSGSLDGTTDFYLDGWQEIEERNASDTVTQQYVYGVYIDEPLIMDVTGSGRFFYHQNTLYSVYALTNSAGEIKEGYQYDAYGKQTTFQAPGLVGVINFTDLTVVTQGGASKFANPYLFTGRRLDPETGLHYYRARYMDPVQGRFISRDSVGVVDGMNLYQYVRSRPTFCADPTGNAPSEPSSSTETLNVGPLVRDLNSDNSQTVKKASDELLRLLRDPISRYAVAATLKEVVGLESESYTQAQHYHASRLLEAWTRICLREKAEPLARKIKDLFAEYRDGNANQQAAIEKQLGDLVAKEKGKNREAIKIILDEVSNEIDQTGAFRGKVIPNVIEQLRILAVANGLQDEADKK